MAFLLTLSSSSNPTNKPITMVPCLLFFTSILHLLKQLQKYARQRNFGLPVYFCECDQCPEATQFMATVTVGDQIFESSGSFNTSKDAESDTAKDESRVYKNLLQELVQREDLSTPVYKTIKRGEPHKPIFFTSVELDGEIFHGKAAKSKKQAELDAARAAYVALQERKSEKTEVFVDPSRDESLIFEILELKEEVGDDGSASWFLQDLASEQESEGCVAISKGRQGREAQNVVRFRIFFPPANNEVNTDILISAYEPIHINPLSESATAVGAGAATPAELSGCVPMLEVFKLAVSTFKVNNWGLFGSELCHKNQWGLPKYTSMRYGPDHNPLFGASV
ncbi:hypothetical protein G4B88_003375 [Cannabis sativa]|uniref:DRBM domain-containing protein n=1 Tax=Cannabis sativa TaxID=3483 RepID=A0A7J6EPX7_CANSA|nr:hypothetical protein G4B88_003375 [Cannabis sativa]